MSELLGHKLKLPDPSAHAPLIGLIIDNKPNTLCAREGILPRKSTELFVPLDEAI
jgi:hypothetical protein